MVVPLVVAGLGGLALSAGANLYSQYNSRQLYRRQIDAYSKMQQGYDRYLARHGRRSNPSRMYLKYGSHADSANTNLWNSYASSVGTAGGTFGAGAMLTQKWL